MFSYLVTVLAALSIATFSQAAEKKSETPKSNPHYSTLEIAPITDADKVSLKKDWSSELNSKRRVAQAQEFTETDFTKNADMVEFRKAVLETKTAEGLEKLLTAAHKEWETDRWANKSDTYKYFVGNFMVMRSMQGLIWKLRPLFETRAIWKAGNKATHGAAVNALRQAATGVETFFPTEQWEAGFDYMTQPSKSMSKADQFKTVADFQYYLAKEFIPALRTASAVTQSVLESSSSPVLVWDRKMVFGPAQFRDDVARYVGFGPAEIYISTAMLQRSIHNTLIFTAYNQDEILNVMGKIGERFGIGNLRNDPDMGMTAKQRNEIVSAANKNKNFLKLVTQNKYGETAMKTAYGYLQLSVGNMEKAYDYLNKSGNTAGFSLNAINFQNQAAPRLDKGIKTLVAVVNGKTDVRDPISGDTVTLNMPAFYNQPYTDLSVLFANSWDSRKPAEASITNANGEKLEYRNYVYNRSIGWNNSQWAKIVPSASGKPADYMLTAKRVVFFTPGAPLATGPIGLFVR